MAPAPEVLARVAEIASDNRSGADTLARKAAEMLEFQAGGSCTDASALRHLLEETARLLVAAQPAMAPIFNLANTVLFAIEGCRDVSSIRAAVSSTCRRFTAEIEKAQEAISEAACQRIPEGAVIVTHSFSSTVATALLGAWRKGQRFSVICTESRPVLEGIALAKVLAGAGIAVRLITDAAIYRHMAGATLAMSGADTVALQGVVNKAGTALLALAARAHRRRFLVLAGTHKFLPASRELSGEPSRDPREIVPEEIAGVTVSNLYFDLTPLSLVTAILSEDGVHPPARVRRRLLGLKVHPALTARLAPPAES